MYVFGGVIFYLCLCVSQNSMETEMAFSGATRWTEDRVSGLGFQLVLFVQVWEGAVVGWRPGPAWAFRTTEAGASVPTLPASRRKPPPPPTSIHKYIRATDKSSLFRNKPRRPGRLPSARQNEAERMGGREGGGGLADPVSRCRFPLKITKRDLFFRTASGWERTLTTQNSFTNGLVLSFSSLGPQISFLIPWPSQSSQSTASCTGQVGGSFRVLLRI